MNTQKLEVLAMAVSEINLAFTPTSEAFAYKNPGRLREQNGNLRNFSTWSGGLKSLISELSRIPETTRILAALSKYGCNSVEKELIALDYISSAIGKDIEATSTLFDVATETVKEN